MAVNHNMQVFLDYLSAAEGTKEDGYHAAFGGRYIEDLTSHPKAKTKFRNKNGKLITTSAAGRYQMTEPTWERLAKKLDLPDFSPESQDAAAIELIREKGAYDDVINGDFESAINKLGKTWASLPSSPYPQAKRSWAFTKAFFDSRLAPVSDSEAMQPVELPPEIVRAPVQIGPGLGSLIGREVYPAPASASAAPPEPSDLESAIINAARDRKVDDSRAKAVSDFLGTEFVPEVELPSNVLKIINAIASEI